jgi:hypothetical protein
MSQATHSRDPIAELAPVQAPDPQRLDAARGKLDERIQTQHSPATPAPSRRRPTAARWLWVGAAASVLGGLVVVMPHLSESAFASWTAEPTLLTGAEAGAARDGCVESINSTFDDPAGTGPDMPSTAEQISDISPVLVEARGQYDVALLSNDRWLVVCMRDTGENRLVGAIDLAQFSRPSDSGFTVYRYEEMGVAPDGEPAVLTFGRVAPGSVGMVVTQSNGFDVHASVSPNGFWAAWWPGKLDDEATATPAYTSGAGEPTKITTALEETYRTTGRE